MIAAKMAFEKVQPLFGCFGAWQVNFRAKQKKKTKINLSRR